jgi:hypothetical protein
MHQLLTEPEVEGQSPYSFKAVTVRGRQRKRRSSLERSQRRSVSPAKLLPPPVNGGTLHSASRADEHQLLLTTELKSP